MSLFSSLPYRGAWTLAPRRVHRIRPGLLEVPTSTLLVPAASPTFLTFRRLLSVAFVRLLLYEARTFGGRVVTLQFHPDDFNPDSPAGSPCGRLRLTDFWPRRRGGLALKHHLKCTRRSQIVRTTRAVIDLVRGRNCSTLSGIAAAEFGL